MLHSYLLCVEIPVFLATVLIQHRVFAILAWQGHGRPQSGTFRILKTLWFHSVLRSDCEIVCCIRRGSPVTLKCGSPLEGSGTIRVIRET